MLTHIDRGAVAKLESRVLYDRLDDPATADVTVRRGTQTMAIKLKPVSPA
ncbi:hypothetical protein [Pararobbsia silviterrae]|nr:hypothetical protein [Pararobbsia silviterrae]